MIPLKAHIGWNKNRDGQILSFSLSCALIPVDRGPGPLLLLSHRSYRRCISSKVSLPSAVSNGEIGWLEIYLSAGWEFFENLN